MAGTSPGHDDVDRFQLFAFFFFVFFVDFLPDVLAFFGTFLPARRASDSPIAIACLRLFTLRPERPLFNVPALRFFMARPTFADAPLEYLRAVRAMKMPFLVTRQKSRQLQKVPAGSRSATSRLEHDPEKCEAIFRKDHAQSKT
jgi:hypothetical protein